MAKSHLKAIVEPNMGTSPGLFVASRQPCIGIAAEPPAKRRLSRRLTPDELAKVSPLPRSYAIAVVLCPGDDTQALATFAGQHKLPSDRFYFFYAPGTDIKSALRHWLAADRSVLYSFEIHDWKGLNQKFGAFWNACVHDDNCSVPGCRMR